ncbi:MAG: acyl-CoA thioesterase II [Acidobacteria bacterium]|nr:MAG: acyl-CoA thioesterase II [Acidobacteriota bacterium]REK04245.1 MAG: acyl-CoA thioesterase II [Acidobacteriota bacterium]
MNQQLRQLVHLLDLEEIEKNHYRGESPDEGWQRVYGGQVLGQALVAASRTVDGDERLAHSLHGYFLRPGDPKAPILYEVDRIRDGRSFTTRRVVAIQHGRAIFNMAISFQVQEQGLEHQFEMPEVPPPEELESEIEIRRRLVEGTDLPEERKRHFTRDRPMDMRPIPEASGRLRNDFDPRPMPPYQNCWIRTADALPDDVRVHQCALAYLSDWSLLDTCTYPHGISFLNEKFQVASLDHAMWFHRPFRADEWLLYVQDSPSAGGGRGFNRGLIYRRDGALVASVVQEGLIRLWP